jgi:large subunit ribosomal protein L9
MKLIFMQDVPNIARAGDTKEVANGYGRNFLIPRNLAIPYTAEAVNLVKEHRLTKTRKEAESEAEIMEMAKQLEGKKITLKARVGAKDHLFGSITSGDITNELKNAFNLVVDKRKIELVEPIRRLGRYEVTIRLTKNAIPKIEVVVTEKETE